MCAQSLSRVQLFAIPSGFSVHGISQARILEWMPFPPPGDCPYLPDPGIEPMSLASPALAGRFFTTEPPGGKCTVRGKYPRNCKVENYQSDFL